MPIILDKFGNVLQKTRDMLFQMFIRKISNDRHDIAETEADFIATKKTNFWLKRASAAMAKTKAMCIINRSTKLIAIQHEKKHGKGSKNSSAYFDNRIDIEQESDVLIADYSFDECNLGMISSHGQHLACGNLKLDEAFHRRNRFRICL